MARGIKDKVAILGMGCSKFGERWDSGAEELMLEAYKECISDAGIDAKQLNAAWFSTAIDEVHVGKSGIPLSTTLRLPNIPVTHVENMCASGTEAFRGACYAVASGAAAAIVTTPEIAKSLGKHNIVSVKALQLSVSNGSESGHNSWDGSYFHTTRIASKKAYEEAGIKKPRDEVSMFEVHDCFSVTELVTMEDLHISETGKGWKDVLDGFYDADGKIPCQIDGGLKCFGHPIGASGLRMLYEMYLQFQGRAGARQLKDPRIGMTHNLGGAPRENVSSVAIVGRFE
jgi:acetyl-CoA acetyltransferase